jgi:hypothetical protein
VSLTSWPKHFVGRHGDGPSFLALVAFQHHAARQFAEATFTVLHPVQSTTALGTGHAFSTDLLFRFREGFGTVDSVDHGWLRGWSSPLKVRLMSQEVNGVPADSEFPGLVKAGTLRDGDTAGDGQGLKVHPLDLATAETPVHFDETITNFANLALHCVVPLMLGPVSIRTATTGS